MEVGKKEGIKGWRETRKGAMDRGRKGIEGRSKGGNVGR